MPDIQIATQSYRSASKRLSVQRLINGFAEPQPGDAKSAVAVFGSPGIDDFVTCGVGPIRGFFTMNGVGYTVSGQSLYSFDADANTTLLGSGIAGSAPVSIDGNAFELSIVNGTQGFNYNVGSATFAQITDPDFVPANTVAFLDGYFAYDRVDTNQFVLSNLYDGTAFSALDYSAAESSPDRVKAVVRDLGLLTIFGETTIERWVHTGALSFPFQRSQSPTTPRGIAGARAFVKEDNATYFIGEDKTFYRLSGQTPVRVSNHAIEDEWGRYGDISDAFCFSFGSAGHKFVAVQFPTARKTWLCDIATGHRWHERQSFDAGGAEAPWRINCALEAFGNTYVGDANSGRIGIINPETYTEFDDPIALVMVFPTVHGDGKRVFFPELEIEVETGVGIASGQGEDPQYMLDWSDDGGRTWSAAQLWQSAGRIGAYRQRLRWLRLGQAFERTFRLRISDPVQRAVLKARCPRVYSGI